MIACDGLDEKERSMDVIKLYMRVNEDVDKETMIYLEEVYGRKEI